MVYELNLNKAVNKTNFNQINFTYLVVFVLIFFNLLKWLPEATEVT